MTRFRINDVLAGTRGELRGSIPAGVAFPALRRDARRVEPGDLFVAIRGERFDGVEFVADASSRGARAAIVPREWADRQPSQLLPWIVVDDTIVALQDWARWHRDRIDADVVGVTGSIGKTSAKESIAAVLGQRSRVYRSPGSYNNEIGLPVSLLEAGNGYDTVVLEMGGAYAHGELSLLAGIAKPHIGVVTNVHPVHLERMGTIDAIAATKSELVRALPRSGIAVLNGDDPRVRAMAGLTDAKVIQYGLGEHNDVRAGDVTTAGLKGTSFWLTIDGERNFVRVPFVGAHGVQVALVALAVGHAFGMHIAEMLTGLQDPDVQVRLLFAPGPGGSHLIDDTYNASTPSVLSALGLLEDIECRRRIAVLGDMRELGDISDDEHRLVGRRAGDVADVVVAFGASARLIAEAAADVDRDGRPLAVRTFAETDKRALIAWLRDQLGHGDIVLVKGSRGLKMEEIVQALRTDVVDETGTGRQA